MAAGAKQLHIPPLSQRIVRSSSVAPPTISTSLRGPCIWTPEILDAAKAEVEQGLSLWWASEKYNISRSTLHDHVSGKVKHGAKPGAKPGPDPYLSMDKETELVSFLVSCANIEYTEYTRKWTMLLVQGILNEKGMHVTISDGWWEHFKNCHPSITLWVAAPLSYAMAKASNQESLNRYFDLLEETLKENSIFDWPSSTYNCDETGMPLNPPFPKVIDQVESSYITGSTKMQK